MAKSTKELPKRNELPVYLTWKLEDIFETDQAWDEELAQLQKDIPQIAEFQGKVSDAADSLYNM
ncbi:oligoendopeptidase F, partial [Halomonas sp. MG34]|nr:oligoendopeptidase F [Halomonas sp. MG34]